MDPVTIEAKTMTTRSAIVLLLAAGATAPRLAHADDAPPCAAEAEAVRTMKERDPSLRRPTNAAAQEHIEAGKRAFGVQEYDKAIEEYTAAGLADEAPLILYNLGQTHRAAKDYEKATRQYRLFLDRGKPGHEVRALVECHIDTMTAELEQAASTAPPTGPDQGSSPDLAVSESVAPSPDVPPSKWTVTRRASLGVAALGVVSAGMGIAFGLHSRGLQSDAARLCPMSPCGDADEANALIDRADASARNANISYAVASAAVVGAAVLWFLGAPEDSSQRMTTISPTLSPTRAGLDVMVRF